MIHCKKHDLEITGCSRQVLSGVCNECSPSTLKIYSREDNNESTKKLGRTVERKRPLREIRATHGKRPFHHRGLLDSRGP